MLPTHAVGIDLGTTYSCIAYLNEHGEPVTIPNRDGEMSTPSVVMFDGDHVVVGTEALRNSIRSPERVVMHAKRHMGDRNHRWSIEGRSFTPVDISTHVIRQLLNDARDRIGKIERAVITVPAQFSEVQRQATAEAGRRAGLSHVDIINEPVAAALCFVLGTEGIWFTELATTQTILVADLGGGTFDLSLVKYEKNSVVVVASGGDLHLGGIDWNSTLEKAIAKQFQKDFKVDLSQDRESRQALAIEVEQAKRSLSVRPKAALTCQHAGHRKTYQVELEQFERLTKPLVDRASDLTKGLLADNKMGWARVDVVLTTGGASRMPMIRNMLKTLSGRTLNTSLSPDQSIAHGATYYAGMLLTNNTFAQSILNEEAASRLRQFKQQSATARALGILVRDPVSKDRVPHYILPANTQLPATAAQIVGTVVDNQHHAHLHVIESGTAADANYVELGTCNVDPLPANLPEGSEIEVSIRYDEQACVHVSAKVLKTGQEAHTEIIRPENLLVSAISEEVSSNDVAVKGEKAGVAKPIFSPVTAPPKKSEKPPSREIETRRPAAPKPKSLLEESHAPVPLCNECGEPLDPRGKCRTCGEILRKPTAGPTTKPATPGARGAARPSTEEMPEDSGPLLSNTRTASTGKLASGITSKGKGKGKDAKSGGPKSVSEMGEDEFYRLISDDGE